MTKHISMVAADTRSMRAKLVSFSESYTIGNVAWQKKEKQMSGMALKIDRHAGSAGPSMMRP
eukprot:COSAG01_NODE_14577_length_1436_cov_1.246073_1_plen_62_part_00